MKKKQKIKVYAETVFATKTFTITCSQDLGCGYVCGLFKDDLGFYGLLMSKKNISKERLKSLEKNIR